MQKVEGVLFDIKAENGGLSIVLKGDKKHIIKDQIRYYFYLLPEERVSKATVKRVEGVEDVEEVSMKIHHVPVKAFKVYVKNGQNSVELAKRLADFGELREDDIKIKYRYLIDKDLFASENYVFEGGKFRKKEEEKLRLKVCAYDIETYNKNGAPNPDKDPIISIAYADESECIAFTWKNSQYKNEKEMITAFIQYLKREDPDIIMGYNADLFDMPYLKKRCNKLGINLELSIDGSEVKNKRSGLSAKTEIFGRVHFDVYKAVSFMITTSGLRVSKKDLETVYKEMLGKNKKEIDGRLIYEYWDKGKIEELVEYNKSDAKATYEIGMKALPIYIALSRIVGFPIQDVINMSATQMIEWILIRDAHRKGVLSPRRPDDREIRYRIMQGPIKGAFVKLPKKGLHENIVVCDFRSLYPSIIISHNIGPDTLNAPGCKEFFESPEGHRFCKDKESIIAGMIKRLVESRIKTKAEMKRAKAEDDKKQLYYKQHSLKILANATYGYLDFNAARWYCRECAESITAWARHYIQNTIKKAEDYGFEVIYGDTDSVFLKLGNKTVEDAKQFVNEINSSLPKDMELEYEGFYPRAIFVTKREGGAAKKRYALLGEDGLIRITGLEFVRRDWAPIARKAQEEVIKTVLKEGDPKKAISIAREIIKELKDGKVSIDDLVVYTPLSRPLENYEQIGPHVKAAQKLKRAGYRVKTGTVIGYIITKGSGSISDRAYPIELLGNRKYDADYYIKHQVIPAVIKILGEFNIKEDELYYNHKQTGLGIWT